MGIDKQIKMFALSKINYSNIQKQKPIYSSVPMKQVKSYENFPLWMPLIAISVPVLGYIIGAIILSGLHIIIAILYLTYCFGAEIFVVFRSCKNCYYYGKICGLGKGKIAPLFVKKGDPNKLAEKQVSWYDLIPDFLVSIFPIVGGIILLILNFSFLILGLIIILAILFFGGTAFIRGSFACKYCKQREIGCPAEKLFSKEKSR